MGRIEPHGSCFLIIASSASPYLGEYGLDKAEDLFLIFKKAYAIFDLLLKTNE